MLKIIIIILIITILLAGIIYGLILGFPGESIIIIRNTKKYVIETYGFTPKELRIINLYMDYPVFIQVKTEENDFVFTVNAPRYNYNYREWSDDYLIRMTEYILEKDLKDYVNKALGANGQAYVSLNTKRLKAFTLDELKADSSLAFELQEKYACRILIYEDPIQENYEINYDSLYNIYSHIFEIGLKPDSISFSFGSNESEGWESILRLSIYETRHTSYNITFSDVNSPNDLKHFLEETIQKKLNEN